MLLKALVDHSYMLRKIRGGSWQLAARGRWMLFIWVTLNTFWKLF